MFHIISSKHSVTK